jgi:1,4-dihydroxy-2-naphthoyl-CoA hydrolase
MNPDDLNKIGEGHLPKHLGIAVIDVAMGRARLELEIVPALLAPNNYLHGGTVVALADTAAGYGCLASMPEGASGFTTIELKTNFIATARAGVVDCVATIAHSGRNTQVWDAVVSEKATGKVMALFRCTQMILYPKPSV